MVSAASMQPATQAHMHAACHTSAHATAQCWACSRGLQKKHAALYHRMHAGMLAITLWTLRRAHENSL
jgi:hypothetical protein